jgi:hypothetical protein
VVAAWCWELIEPYLRRRLQTRGVAHPGRAQLLEEFARVWPELTLTVGVQAPHGGTIRFKWLARLPAPDVESALEHFEGWLAARWGGGKYKVNVHHGLHFVATRNFKPAGEPRWQDAPELADE